MAAGIIFGLFWGTIIASIASTIGAIIAFLITRHLSKTWIAKKINRSPHFHTINKVIDTQGTKIVLLLRLSPIIPFNILNYALGLTRINFSRYLIASWIGMLPATILYVYLGSLIKNIATLAETREKTLTE